MNTEKIYMKDIIPGCENITSSMDAYWQTDNDENIVGPRPAIIIFPGGAYMHTSKREGDPVAIKFSSLGYQCFILWYTCLTEHYPQQLLEGVAAVNFVRKNADKYNVDPNKISVLGFSAGGHAAGAVGTLWKEPVLSETLSVPSEDLRPDAMVLAYPVITSEEGAHRYSIDMLLGPDRKDDKDLLEKVSLEKAVDFDTPPAFIWATADDSVVPSENSLLMALALKRHNIDYELHIYGSGPHGVSLANGQTPFREPEANNIDSRLARWTEDCDYWLKSIYSKK